MLINLKTDYFYFNFLTKVTPGKYKVIIGIKTVQGLENHNICHNIDQIKVSKEPLWMRHVPL